MTEETARNETEGRARLGHMGLWKKVLLAIVLLPFAALFLPTLAVLALGMLPTLSAYVVDRSREKHLAVTVGLLNFCGCMHALIGLWATGQSYEAMSAAIYNVYNWLIAYGAAGCGWLIYLFMPSIVLAYYRVASEARIQILKSAQRKLIETWGEEVAGHEEAQDPS